MNQLKWIQTSLLLTALLQSAAAGILNLNCKVGEDVKLRCEGVRPGQQKCENTTWVIYSSGGDVELVKRGQVRLKADRLSLTEDCSLLIKKITEEDTGDYRCRQEPHRLSRYPPTSIGVNVIRDMVGTPPPPTATSNILKEGTIPDATVQHGTCSGLDLVMLALRVAELLLITVITVLLFRARGNQRPPDDDTVYDDVGEGSVYYENDGEPSASVRLH